MRKKLLLLFLTIISVVCLATGLTACGGNSEHVHSLIHYVAVDATDTDDGNIEYWYCPGCDTYFLDEDGMIEADENEIFIEATGTTTYTVTFVADGREIRAEEYQKGDSYVSEPSVPSKEGYEGVWESYTLSGGNITVNAVYTPIEYLAVFLDVYGDVLSTVVYTVEDDIIEEPDVPEIMGYEGVWESYDLSIGDIEISPVYTPIRYTATFLDENGEVYYTTYYTVESWSIYEPSVPSKSGYTGVWEDYTLEIGGITIKPVYSITAYTITFVADDTVVDTVTYTEGTTEITEPAVPAKDGFDGKWSSYIIGSYDQTVTALYTSSGATDGLTYNYISSYGTIYYCVEGYTGDSEDIVIPEIYENTQVTGISVFSSRFNGKDNVKSITIPASISYIGSTFTAFTSLEAVYISDIEAWCNISFNGSDIGVNPLYTASNLYLNNILVTDLDLPDSVTTISAYAFAGCTSLKSINIGYTTVINASTFQNCTSLTKIEWSGTVSSIGDRAFYGCTSLSQFDSSIDGMCIIPSATLGDYAFYGCTSLVTLKTNEATSIGKYSFYGCTSLKEIVIGDSLKYIYEHAFYGCTSLESLTIPSTVNYIDSYSFTNCTALESVSLSCNQVYNYAFYGCTALSEVTLSYSNVKNIGNSAFKNCSSVANVYAYSLSSWNSITFGDEYANPLNCGASLYFYDSTSNSYEVVAEITFTGSVSAYAFYNCQSLVSVTLGTNVSNISTKAFYGCINLIAVYNLSSLPVTAGSTDNGYVAQNAKNVYTTESTGESVLIKGDYTFYIDDEGNYYLMDYNGTNTALSLPELTDDDGNTIYYAIYDNVFDGNSKIKSITVPDSVTSIGENAFKNCSSLETLVIGSGVTSISEGLLYGCSSLKSLTIPFVGASSTATTASETTLFGYIFGTSSYTGASATKQYYGNSIWYYETYYIPNSLTSVTVTGGNILYGAFYNCINLVSFTLGSDITSIGTNAFSGCYYLVELYNLSSLILTMGYTNYGGVATYAKVMHSSLSDESHLIIKDDYLFVYSDGYSVYLVTYYGEDTELTLPSAFVIENDSYTMTDYNYWILPYAFYNMNITSVKLSDNVSLIGEHAFDGCSKLTTVDMVNYGPLNVIDDYAFYECTALTEFANAYSLKNIGNYAFYGCTSLTSMYIGPTVTSIGDYAFCGCTALTDIYFDATAMDDLSGGNNAFYEAGQSGDGLTITIGTNVTKISAYLFYNGNNIISIIFEDNGVCENIGNYAFSGCSSLGNISIPDSVTSIGDYAFYDCTSLTSIEIPDSITSISDFTFYGCTSLTSITVPTSIKTIGNGAFQNCTSLISITIPDNVISIGNYAFKDCTAVTEINFNATAMNDLSSYNYVFQSAGQNNDGITVTIGANVTKIPAYLFCSFSSGSADSVASSYAPKITSIIFENNSVCTIIGSQAFCYCKSLTSITIPESITSIGACAFYNCTALTKINFNATAMVDLTNDYSENWVFYKAGQSGTGITVTIGANVTKIPAYLFYINSSSDTIPKITSVVFGENSVCESIGDCAFHMLTSLTSITLPNSLTSIGDYAFQGCTSLTSITIPENVATIGGVAFQNCTSLTSVTIGNSVETIGISAFYGCTSLTSVTIGNSVETIGSSAFYDCTSLTSVTIGNSVETIGSSAFYDCMALTEINFNATAMNDLSYSDRVFYKAGQSGDGITVAIGANVTKIPAYLFYGSSSSYAPKIVSVEFEDGSICESIGNDAFYYCSSLKSITIPDSVTSIGSSAFYGCTSLTTVTFENTSGWYRATTSGATSGTTVSSTTVANASTMATYLKSTYYSYYWYRSES